MRQEIEQHALEWPAEGSARVPYWMFSDPGIYRAKLRACEFFRLRR